MAGVIPSHYGVLNIRFALRTLFKFRGDPEPQPNLQYVGRAFDARTGKQVVNIGLLNPAQ